jgi:capsular polysaccharide transport system ATP-binding protein
MLDLRHVSKFYQTRTGRREVLSGVNLRVEKSERVGILGRNGAGKSTLIRIIGGSEQPTSGDVERGMSISWPLAFAGGFQGSLTGLDNLRFVCRIYNASYDDALPFVEDFTELKSYLREPVKRYSSGMRARLAFAISMAVDFDCFLIDEVLAVGDTTFQEKCRQELFVNKKHRAMLMVSHDADMIREHCTRACVLEKGILREFDDVESAYIFYHEEMNSTHKSHSLPDSNSITKRVAVGDAAGKSPAANSDISISASSNIAVSDENDRIVGAFYRQLLGRAPEPIGLRHHSAWMQSRDRDTAVDDMLKVFLATDECRKRLGLERRGRLQMLASGPNLAVDQVVSLGSYCYTGAFLERFGLPKMTSVFDLIPSNSSMVAHALNDDFETLLDKQHYVTAIDPHRPHVSGINKVQHSFYTQKHGIDSFFDRNVIDSEHYAYLARCVDRFREVLSSNGDTLFLLIQPETDHTGQEFEAVRRELLRRSPNAFLVYIAVAHEVQQTGVPTIDPLARQGTAVSYRFAPSSYWQPYENMAPLDELYLYNAIFRAFPSRALGHGSAHIIS